MPTDIEIFQAANALLIKFNNDTNLVFDFLQAQRLKYMDRNISDLFSITLRIEQAVKVITEAKPIGKTIH